MCEVWRRASDGDTGGRLVDFAAERMDVGIRYGDGRWPDLKSTFLLRDAFFRSAVRPCSKGCTRCAVQRT